MQKNDKNKCPFQENNTKCGKYPIHYYEPSKRKETIKVMKYTGLRMIWHHSEMTIQHLFNKRKNQKILRKR